MAAYTSAQVPAVLAALQAEGVLQPSEARAGEDMLIAYDLDALRASFQGLVQAFPPHFLHCYAVKAAPMGFVIEEAVRQGMGIEAASLLEVENALAHGCPPERIVFDSPAKTYRELDFALAHGIHINANTLEELDRIASILSTGSSSSEKPPSVGLRINPLVGAGRIEELSVSTLASKFGVNLIGSHKEEILAKFRQYPWLCGLHIHVGSQGFDMAQTVQGVSVLLAFCHEVEAALGNPHPRAGKEGHANRRIKVLDIGGGLSANYHTDEATPTPAQFAALLRDAVPELFADPALRVVTEFGRSLTAKTGWVVSRVEYAFDNAPLEVDPLRTAILHAGADVLLRECYVPHKFPHRITVHDRDGRWVGAEEGAGVGGRVVRPHNLAGPLCFAGDVIARGIALPRVEAGDWVVVHDCGGYTLALYSRYCSRPAPAVVGYERKEGGEGGLVVRVLQAQESGQAVVDFWGARGRNEPGGRE